MSDMLNVAGRLRVIDEFQIDDDLPKFQAEDEADPEQMESESPELITHLDPNDLTRVRRTRRRRSRFSSGVMFTAQNPGVILEPDDGRVGPDKPSLFKRIFGKKPKAPPPPEVISVEEFFTSVKLSMKQLEIVKERAAGYEAALRQAHVAGQTALEEKLAAGINAYKMETLLISMGMTKYVEERDVVTFYKQSKRGLRLDWIRNFARPIPAEVIARKAQADELGIFDNYVVLHYDPQAKAFAETLAEKAARRDPILFGLMEHRDRLYFIGDWVDEYCDLTLDQFAEAMGKDAIHQLAPGQPYRDKP